MTWFEKIIPSRIKTERRSRSVPEGLWIKCSSCETVSGAQAGVQRRVSSIWVPPVKSRPGRSGAAMAGENQLTAIPITLRSSARPEMAHRNLRWRFTRNWSREERVSIGSARQAAVGSSARGRK